MERVELPEDLLTAEVANADKYGHLLTQVENLTKEEILEKQREEENRIYRTHKLSLKDFNERRKKWDEVQAIYGNDPFFYSIFGFLDPLLAIQFVDENEIEQVVDSISEKELADSQVRNPTHSRLLRKLKNKREEDKKKSQDK